MLIRTEFGQFNSDWTGKKQCSICDREFFAHSGSAKYCHLCEPKCIWCGKIMKTRNQKCCSNSCATKYQWYKKQGTGNSKEIQSFKLRQSKLGNLNPQKKMLGCKNPNWKSVLVKCNQCLVEMYRPKKEIYEHNFCSRKCLGLWNSKNRIGKNSPHYGFPAAHGKGCWYKKDDKEIWLRSSYEKLIADYLSIGGINWEYEPKKFYLDDRSYTPDFYLPEFDLFLEVKGWFHKRHQDTIRQFKEKFPGLKLILILPNDMKQLGLL